MLEDRNYMQGSSFSPRRSITMTLVIANVVVFVLQYVLEALTPFRVVPYLGLSVLGLSHGYVWQLLTYAFLHADLLHLVFNLWAIYVFGNEVEHALGRRPFLALYLGSALIGALFQVAAGLMFKFFAAPTVGASAAAFGLAAAFAMLFPERILLLFFIIPIRAKYLIAIMGVLTLLGVLQPGRIAHAAHLGGMLCGLAFVRFGRDWAWDFTWLRFRPRFPRIVRTSGKSGGPPWPKKSARPGDEIMDDDFLSREVDPILDKISASGIQSLTDRERRILEQARERMAKR